MAWLIPFLFHETGKAGHGLYGPPIKVIFPVTAVTQCAERLVAGQM
jgi:hypothetical protein